LADQVRAQEVGSRQVKSEPRRQLRILIADERQGELEHVARVVARLGHMVIAKSTDIGTVAALTETEPVDVTIVAVGTDNDHALALIGRIVREATCPVIALLDVEDPAFIHQAAKRGVFAYITRHEAGNDQFASAIEVVLHRFAEYHDLEGAFGRRALTERAKGILMERHGLDEEAAFSLLREHSRTTNSKLIDVAQAVLDARALLSDRAAAPD
jgi:AmiR/NasT family two-component response regulator